MSRPLSIRLDFLKNSAHFLSLRSPSTSAYLMTARSNIIVFDGSSYTTTGDDMEACPACGSIRTPGVNSRVFTRTEAPPKPTRLMQKPQHEAPSKTPSMRRCVVYECTRCKHEVVRHLPQPTRQRRRRDLPIAPSVNPSMPSNTGMSQIASTDSRASKTGSENSSSKKRAKLRKQKGLLASLSTEKQRSQLQSKPTNSLDLMDFFQST